ncbi:MAG: NgoMIV family type II restriction endonuclease [Pseudomonadota bacterium]
MNSETWLARARREFHSTLLSGPLSINAAGVPSNADGGSKVSVALARAIIEQIGSARSVEKLAGQTAGAKFEEICATYIGLCFDQMSHLRAGRFFVSKGGGISKFEQYAHLARLEKVARQHRDVALALGSDYLIKPDVVIGRYPEPDSVINAKQNLVDSTIATLTSLREVNSSEPILHASISCKWTLRSDRAQNARSEGLNLIRNRKGRLPHIVVITGEPMPSRLASLALGTGDLDCVYHIALPELIEAARQQGKDDTTELLTNMVEGKRLRDISDLPLDLVT